MFKKLPYLLGTAVESAGGAGAMADITAAAAPLMYRVWDSNAGFGKPRSHEIIIHEYDDGRDPDTKIYALTREGDGDGVEMPFPHAMKFLVDKAFVVKNRRGDRIAPPAKTEGGLGALQLQPDQVVANLSELSKQSLYKRCAMLPGGERVATTDEPGVMIEFLVQNEKRRRRVTSAAGDADLKLASGDLDGAVDEKTLSGMFGGNKPH